jgi:hypothetical protein
MEENDFINWVRGHVDAFRAIGCRTVTPVTRELGPLFRWSFGQTFGGPVTFWRNRSAHRPREGRVARH